MARYTIPDIAPGTVPTGANIDSWLADVQTRSGSITSDQQDPEGRFDASMFLQNASVEHINVVGVVDGNASTDAQREKEVTQTFYALTDGVLDANTGFNMSTGAAATLTITKNDSPLAVNGTIAEGDKIETTAAENVTGTARFLWRLVGPSG